jgi:hypothetical protein
VVDVGSCGAARAGLDPGGVLGHDGGHQQIAASRAGNTIVGLVAGNLQTGLSIGWWADKHHRHHANPNKEGHDPDIGEGVLAFTTAQAATRTGRLARIITAYQAVLFFPLLTLNAADAGGFGPARGEPALAGALAHREAAPRRDRAACGARDRLPRRRAVGALAGARLGLRGGPPSGVRSNDGSNMAFDRSPESSHFSLERTRPLTGIPGNAALTLTLTGWPVKGEAWTHIGRPTTAK